MPVNRDSSSPVEGKATLPCSWTNPSILRTPFVALHSGQNDAWRRRRAEISFETTSGIRSGGLPRKYRRYAAASGRESTRKLRSLGPDSNEKVDWPDASFVIPARRTKQSGESVERLNARRIVRAVRKPISEEGAFLPFPTALQDPLAKSPLV
ncbi:hypothetical protein KM043_001336 [Ampulex compressa]|nr:hypothetical protein KM043_001336 [Ampulex compressa]